MLLAIAIAAVTYVHAHDIAVHENGADKKYHVNDTLRIQARDDQTITFSLSIAGSNASSCTLKGTAKKIADHFEHSETLDTFDDHPKCVLQIQFDDKHVVMTDVGDVCRRGYCGAQATIGRTEFKPRAASKKKH
jgi:hypothetical protein